MIIVSPNERQEIKTLIGDEGIESTIPYDFRLYTRKGAIAVERKHFPSDMLASVEDGRLAKECAAMRHAKYRVLISEGVAKYNQQGYLLNGHRITRWTRAGIRNLFRSIRYCEDVDIEFTRSIPETVQVLHELQSYFDTDSHHSIRVRPTFSPEMLYKTDTERYIYWLQGLPGIGYERACEMRKWFRCPLHVFEASQSDLMRVPGIGKVIAKGIYSFLREPPKDLIIEDACGGVSSEPEEEVLNNS